MPWDKVALFSLYKTKSLKIIILFSLNFKWNTYLLLGLQHFYKLVVVFGSELLRQCFAGMIGCSYYSVVVHVNVREPSEQAGGGTCYKSEQENGLPHIEHFLQFLRRRETGNKIAKVWQQLKHIFL